MTVRDLEIAVSVRERRGVGYRRADRRSDVAQNSRRRVGAANRVQIPGERGSLRVPKRAVERRFGAQVGGQFGSGVVQGGARFGVVAV